MKKEKIKIAILLSFFLTTTVTSCFELIIPVTPNVKNDVKKEEKTNSTAKTGIVDKWEYGNQVFIEVNGNNLISPVFGTIEFKNDNTFEWNFKIGEIFNYLKGNYTISSDKLILNYSTGTKEEFTWSIGKDKSGEDWLEIISTTAYGSKKIDGFTRVKDLTVKPTPTSSPSQNTENKPSNSPIPSENPTPSANPIGEDIKWGEEKKSFFDIPFPPMVLLIGDELKFGGLDLTDMSKTDQKVKTDIRFEGQYLYSRGLIELDETLTSKTKSNLSGYVNYVKYTQNKVYLTIRADGSYAKIRIDRVTPSRVDFSYVLEIKDLK